ncbi:MAG: ROK family glucokinase [Candidatus Izemoplasma sp.]|nr:ROK family glucokinase [Candidatus Izemoplasma sp.]
MKQWIIGIDVGGTTVKIGKFSRIGDLIKKWEIPTNTSNHGSHILKDIYDAIKREIPNLDDIHGYGFGVPGPVHDNFIEVAVNLGWKDVDLPKTFGKLVNNDNIVVANDANVATLGEAAFGAAKGLSNVALITLGTGVGSGLVINNMIIDGVNGNAGEIGHMAIHSDYHFPCNCGKVNCLETFASASGVRNLYHAINERYNENSILDDMANPSAKQIFDAAKQGDRLATQVTDEVADAIGYGCHVYAMLVNPKRIVLGGGLAKAGDFLLTRVQKAFTEYVFDPVKDTEIVLATLGNDAGIYGAAEMVRP